MAEMTFKAELPPAYGLVGLHVRLLDAVQELLMLLKHDGDRWIYSGSDAEVEAVCRATVESGSACYKYLGSAPEAAAPDSSGDRILALTREVADLSEMMVAHHNARRTAEKALEEITRIAEQTLVDIDGQLDAMSASVNSRRNA